MSKLYYTPHFAANYGDNAYSDCAYNEGCSVGTGTASDSSSGGSLTNTGVAIIGLVSLACLIICLAIIVRWWRRPSRRVAEEVVVSEEPDNENNHTTIS